MGSQTDSHFRVGLSLKQARGLYRYSRWATNRLGAFRYSEGRRFESGPAMFVRGTGLPRGVLDRRPYPSLRPRDGEGRVPEQFVGRGDHRSGPTRALPRFAWIPPVLEYPEKRKEARRCLPWARRHVPVCISSGRVGSQPHRFEEEVEAKHRRLCGHSARTSRFESSNSNRES